MTPCEGCEHLCHSAWVLFWYAYRLIHCIINNLNFKMKKFKRSY